MKDFNLRKYLAENRLLKEEIVFPELKDEFEGYQDAMLGSDEEYLQDIIYATPEELLTSFLDLNGGYYEVALAVDDGRYSAGEAVELAKQWAMAKLLDLIGPIDTFLNKNFKEVQDKINKNIPDEAEFKIMGDPKVATIAVTDEDGIDISIDKTHMEELFGKNDPENPITTTKISGITVHYNDYL